MNRSELENTKNILKNIIVQPVDTIELEEQKLPQIEDLTYSNKSYKVKCSILFIDIRESTQLSKNLTDKAMLKVYRSFIRMATQCVRYSGGYTRQFLGDRIMGIFLDDIDDEGNIIKKSSDKAINSAREMNTYIDYVLNNLISKSINGKYIKCGIGICTGKVLLSQVGMKGVEQDKETQNEKGDIWVGYITNQASKFADLTMPREIFIDDNTFNELNEENRKKNTQCLWKEEKRYKGNKRYDGYISKNLYVQNLEELQLAKFEYEDSEKDKIKQEDIKNKELLYGIREIIEEYKIKESSILQKEEKLKEKERKLVEKEDNINNYIKEKEYDMLYDLIYNVFIEDVKVKELGRAYWLNKIDKLVEKGKEIGKSKYETLKHLTNSLLIIYMDLELYDEAYEILVMHVKEFSYFPYNGLEVIKKAKLRNTVLTILKDKVYTIEDTSDRIGMLENIKEIEEVVLGGNNNE